MRISKLWLCNFRNYCSEQFNFVDGINVIFGGNAQGKTNILESIFLCSCGRSHRTSKDQEMIKVGTQGFKVSADIISSGSNPSIEIYLKKGEKKKICVNGTVKKKIGELLGNIRVVMFSPEDLLIVKGPPQERRRFIDIAISQMKSTYFFELQNYGRLLKQRNNLLKEMKETGKKDPTLDVWSEALADAGTRIMLERLRFLNKLNEYALEKHGMITGGKERLEIRYRPSFAAGKDEGREEIKNRFLRALEENLEKETHYRMTITGPHRDDWEIRHNGMQMREYGSQGQQRSAVLSIKLAEIEIIKEETGQTPVLLLDDVMSELDESRKRFIIDALCGMQTLITTTEKDIIGRRNDINFIEIKDGKRISG